MRCLDCTKAAEPGSSRCGGHSEENEAWRKGWDGVRRRVLEEETHCWLCGEYVDEGEKSVDHVVKRQDGGTNDRANLRLAHLSCNSSRK